MTLTQRSVRVSFLLALGLAACADDPVAEPEGTTTTGEPTTYIPETPTSSPDPSQTGTTEPEPTTTATTSGTTTASATSEVTSGTTTGETTSDPGTSGTSTGTSGETGGTAGDEAVYALCKTIEADAAKFAELQCKCQVEAGEFPDLEACLAEKGTPPEQVECTCEVYAKYPESKPALECLIEPYKQQAECHGGVACDDQSGQQACFEVYFDAVLDCPAPPPEASDEIAFSCDMQPFFMCESGEKVPLEYQCDFTDDCTDGSDEVDCEGGFECSNGNTIPEDYKCDGFLDCCEGDPDCRDDSDEAGCPVFMCMGGGTVPESAKCDDFEDCADGSDELGCPVFMCMDGGEVPLGWKCDGTEDCEDGSDEQNCP